MLHMMGMKAEEVYAREAELRLSSKRRDVVVP
jgi:hypothetical protein